MYRYIELDSLRGIAAFTVMLAHCTMVDFHYKSDLWFLLNDTPVRFFWAGHQAVIFFFVLSGFVLALSFIENKKRIYMQNDYKNFLIKRFFRIYVPYIITIFIAISIRIYFSWHSLHGFEDAAYWSNPISSDIIKKHFFPILFFDSNTFNPIIWSLVHEMRISIIFPFVIIALCRYDFKVSVISAIFLSLLSGIIYVFFIPYYWSFIYDYYQTLHYLSFFIIGFILARYRILLVDKYKKITTYRMILLYIGAFLIYTYSFYNHWAILQRFAGDWGIAIGSSFFIIAAISSNKFSKLLLFKPIAFIGKISYSLYLYHFIVLLSLINLLYGKVPSIWIYIATISITIVAACASFYWVEQPSIAAGKIVNAKINNISYFKK